MFLFLSQQSLEQQVFRILEMTTSFITNSRKSGGHSASLPRVGAKQKLSKTGFSVTIPKEGKPEDQSNSECTVWSL